MLRLVVVRDFDVVGIAILPSETNPVLIVDASDSVAARHPPRRSRRNRLHSRQLIRDESTGRVPLGVALETVATPAPLVTPAFFATVAAESADSGADAAVGEPASQRGTVLHAAELPMNTSTMTAAEVRMMPPSVGRSDGTALPMPAHCLRSWSRSKHSLTLRAAALHTRRTPLRASQCEAPLPSLAQSTDDRMDRDGASQGARSPVLSQQPQAHTGSRSSPPLQSSFRAA